MSIQLSTQGNHQSAAKSSRQSRAKAAAERAGNGPTAAGDRERSAAEILALNLGNAGVPKAAALLIGQLLGRIEALDAQVNILHETIKNLSAPHMRKVERRG
jgi:hypothetical protein